MSFHKWFCEYCFEVNGHAKGCPNYNPPKTSHYCSICGEGIQYSEEYIVNGNEDCAHWECVDYSRDLAKFLGYKIKTKGYEGDVQ